MGLALAGVFLLAVAQANEAACPANVARSVWEAAADGEVEFLVVLAEQADLGAAAALPSREARLRYVYDTLRETALRTQASLRAELDRTGVEYRPFYIANMLLVQGDRSLIARLAGRAEVARIAANPHVHPALPVTFFAGAPSSAPQGIEWGVARVNADDVWALGFTGQGVVVAGQDTGYAWSHPALARQYRGYNGLTVTHDYNWHDAIHENDPHTWPGNLCGFDSPTPCDDNGHGTHTMGTIVGDDGAGNQIGVAPGARWIGCRNMEEGWGTPATYAECFEFFLAPYPIGGDPFTDGVPSLAPHVINNSWSCPPAEGCDWDTLQTIVENVRAAGIVIVASAGNEGPSCSSVGRPIAIYDASFSVGATSSNDLIASFSSRGPVTVDGSGRLKPDVAAPGVSVRSSLPSSGYGLKSGTSMAAPHVTGVIALVWSAAPRLIGDVDATESIIARTARPRVDASCGGDPGGHPNNVYGWGIVDALAAVESARAGLAIGKQAAFPFGLPPRQLVYTLHVTNASPLTLTWIVLTDTIPANTTLAWASGVYTHAGGVITWTFANVPAWGMVTATLAVTIEHLAPGAQVTNMAYGAFASESVPPARGEPLETAIPWRLVLFPVFRNWPAEGEDDG